MNSLEKCYQMFMNYTAPVNQPQYLSSCLLNNHKLFIQEWKWDGCSFPWKLLSDASAKCFLTSVTSSLVFKVVIPGLEPSSSALITNSNHWRHCCATFSIIFVPNSFQKLFTWYIIQNQPHTCVKLFGSVREWHTGSHQVCQLSIISINEQFLICLKCMDLKLKILYFKP